MDYVTPIHLAAVQIPPTDLHNLPNQKSYDIFNLIEPMMISIHHHATDLSDIIIALCVSTTHLKFCLTTRCSGGLN